MSCRYSCRKYCSSSSSSSSDDCCRQEKKCIVDENFIVTNLVSNLPNVAPNQDANLVNPWGIVNYSGRLWVADNGTGLITTYNLNGVPLLTIITVPPAMTGTGTPTGLVVNTGTNFVVTNGMISGPATLITCTEDGTVSGYNATVNATSTIIVVDRSSENAIYKGLTIANNNLYVADFHNNRIDVFDNNFNLLAGFPFVDPALPIGYAPFNITYICGKLYVSYAKQDSNAEDDVAGLGNGFVSMFSVQGVFLGRFLSGGYLNSPWSILRVREDTYAQTCTGCGIFLVGNFGDGTIGVYTSRGAFIGRLRDRCGMDIIIDGLWGLAYGRSIYFASGPNNEINGLVGTLLLC